jgi:type II secretory pathway component PulK
MKIPGRTSPASNRGSVLVIVLWVALGLVSITLYFASSMNFELRASDNRYCGLAAEQAIEGGARYAASVIASLATNGVVPDVGSYENAAVPVGESHFWFIGRPGDRIVQPDEVFFGLVDEGSKLNLNTATADMLSQLPAVTPELAANIVDWASTNDNTTANGDGSSVYSSMQPGYICKNAPFETLDELRLVYGTDMGTLNGEDENRNGTLDPSETDTNRNNLIDPGLFEYTTVYSREPNTRPDGSARVSVSTVNPASAQLIALLRTNLTADRLTPVLTAIGAVNTPRPRGAPAPAARRYGSLLAFYIASGMTSEEFALVASGLTVTNSTYVLGRVNVNTASAAVLAALPGMTSDLALQLANYRRTNPDKLTTVAWIVDALGSNNNQALTTLGAGDYITTQSFQFTADIGAVGPYGRGYRRVKFVFDTISGTPKLIYRQDLTHLGWGLGKYARQNYLATGKGS